MEVQDAWLANIFGCDKRIMCKMFKFLLSCVSDFLNDFLVYLIS